MMKINENRNLGNGQTISIRKEDNAYRVYINEEISYTASLLECRAYAEARLEGWNHDAAVDEARKAIEKKNSRPTEAQKAHELGMTIREYRAHRKATRQAAQTTEQTTEQTAEQTTGIEEAIEKARKNGLDLSLDRMAINLRVDLETGEVVRMASESRRAVETELKLWADLWDQNLVAVKRAA